MPLTPHLQNANPIPSIPPSLLPLEDPVALVPPPPLQPAAATRGARITTSRHSNTAAIESVWIAAREGDDWAEACVCGGFGGSGWVREFNHVETMQLTSKFKIRSVGGEGREVRTASISCVRLLKVYQSVSISNLCCFIIFVTALHVMVLDDSSKSETNSGVLTTGQLAKKQACKSFRNTHTYAPSKRRRWIKVAHRMNPASGICARGLHTTTNSFYCC